MNMRALAALCLISCAASLSAQYGKIAEAAAGGEGPSVGESLLLVGAAAGSLEPELRAEDARAALGRLGFRLPRAADGERISWGDLAFLAAQLYDLPGGFAYRAFPSPRTAFKEALGLGLLPPGARPSDQVGGADLLFFLRRLEESKAARP